MNGQFVYLCIFVICLWQVFGGSCDEFGHLKPCNPGSHEGSFNWTYPETEDLHNRPPQRQDNAVLTHVTNGFWIIAQMKREPSSFLIIHGIHFVNCCTSKIECSSSYLFKDISNRNSVVYLLTIKPPPVLEKTWLDY